MTIQEQMRLEVEFLRKSRNGAFQSTADTLDRAARALDAADTALDDCALVLMRGSASKAETLKVMQKVQAALAEIRGGK